MISDANVGELLMKYSIDLISDMVPALKLSDTGGKALTLMEVFKVSHLPVVDRQQFLGLVSETNILDMNDPDVLISDYKLDMDGTFMGKDVPAFEVLSLASDKNLSVITVVDLNRRYLGAITVSDLLLSFVKDSSLHMQGGIIVLEVNIKDYSLSHIAQIVESNDAKVLNSYVLPIPDSSQVEVVVKVNTDDLTSILQTFNRYSYLVTNVYNATNQMDDILDDRYDQLMKFLDL